MVIESEIEEALAHTQVVDLEMVESERFEATVVDESMIETEAYDGTQVVDESMIETEAYDGTQVVDESMIEADEADDAIGETTDDAPELIPPIRQTTRKFLASRMT